MRTVAEIAAELSVLREDFARDHALKDAERRTVITDDGPGGVPPGLRREWLDAISGMDVSDAIDTIGELLHHPGRREEPILASGVI